MLKKRFVMWAEKRSNVLLLLPSLMVLLVFGIYLIGALIYLSFCDWNVQTPAPVFSGIDNYIAIVKDPNFWASLGRTAIYVIASVAAQVVLGFVVAYALNRRIPGLGVLRTLMIVPMAMTPVIVGIFWKILLDPSLGPINYYLSCVGISGPQWLAAKETALASVITVSVWASIPFCFLTITAGMNALPKDVYEAATVDGATKFQALFKLTLPMLKQVLLTLIILRSIDALKAFDFIYTMTNGGPGDATQILPFYIYLKGFHWFDFGAAAALSVVLLVIAGVLCKVFINKTGVKEYYEN